MSKTAVYQQLQQQIAGLIDGEPDLIANLANISAAIFNSLHDLNWAGFYLYKDDQLVLGPFQGLPACIRIPMGKGVCGTAASTRQTQKVDDVHQFAGHIACDAASNSEVVIPIIVNQQLLGVLDIDSPKHARFDDDDVAGLENIVQTLVDQLS
ncbi:GAF domain-containing protein [Aestuariibacter halophilus]|uniref:GAF domain-containing protein n=1 Tax=Fluctibacter halophilus TaxID=226011 RepID=A0ABS8G5H7_9ALTE|nr:GAF domain-containing protein [Aestuariibacter halophilus]MCC2615663.1 GAF domain-containing protein [Aestuariibacter halophilus]